MLCQRLSFYLPHPPPAKASRLPKLYGEQVCGLLALKLSPAKVLYGEQVSEGKRAGLTPLPLPSETQWVQCGS